MEVEDELLRERGRLPRENDQAFTAFVLGARERQVDEMEERRDRTIVNSVSELGRCPVCGQANKLADSSKVDRYDSNVRVMLLFLSSGSFKVEFMTETAIWCACFFVGWYVYDGKVQ